MSYPKPLSEKSLRRLYGECGLSDQKVAFLRTFFEACANLYGVIVAENAWDVYKELSSKSDVLGLQRKDMYRALGVLRRENVPFYVFEADEVFSDEKRTDKYRVIALRELIHPGYGKYMNLYSVLDAAEGKPFFVPEDLLSYAEMPVNQYERVLLDTLGGLKSTLSEYEDRMGHKHPCPYKGKYLKDFSYIGEGEAFELERLRGEIEGYKGNAEKAEELKRRLESATAAQYLVGQLKRQSNVGRIPISRFIEYFFDDLNAMGVRLKGEKQVNDILRLVNNMHNNQHLWCNRGWTPKELSKQISAWDMPTLSFGPNIQKAFSDGSMNKEELIRELKKMGIEVLE